MIAIPDENDTASEEVQNRETTRKVLKGFTKKRYNLIPVLQKVQGSLGYLPREAMTEIAEYLDIPAIDVYGVTTFYNQFRLEPVGKHIIRVCVGTACHVRGATKVVEEVERQLGIEAGETTKDGKFTLETVNCLGACALGPLVVVDEDYHGKMDARKVSRMLKQYMD